MGSHVYVKEIPEIVHNPIDIRVDAGRFIDLSEFLELRLAVIPHHIADGEYNYSCFLSSRKPPSRWLTVLAGTPWRLLDCGSVAVFFRDIR